MPPAAESGTVDHPAPPRAVSPAPFLMLLMLAAAGARLPELFSTPLDLDEGYTLLTARRGLLDPIRFGPCDRNPLLAHLPHALWVAVFGGSKEGLELVSFLCGLAVIPFAYLLGREMFNQRTGFLAASGVALSTFHIFYSQYIRVYSMAVLLLSISLLYFFRWLRSHEVLHRRGAKAGSSRSGGIALATALAAVNLHYYAALSVGAGLAFLAAAAVRRKFLRRPLVLSALALLLGAAPTIVWQKRVLDQLTEPTWIAPPDLEAFASIWFHLSSQSIPLMILLVSLAVSAAVRLTRGPDRFVVLLLLALIGVPIAVPLIFSFWYGPVFHLRYFIFVSVPFLLLAAGRLSALEPAALYRTVLALALAASVGAVWDDLRKRPLNRPGTAGTLELFKPREAPLPGVPLIFTSKCGYVSAAAGDSSRAPSYLLKSDDDTWVLKCIAGSDLEIDQSRLAQFERFTIINQGCPPVPSRVELCTEQAFSSSGFKRLRSWIGGAACEFSK